MKLANPLDTKSNLIDVASASESEKVCFDGHLRAGDVTLARCTLQPNHGDYVGWAQVTAAVYDGPPFRMDWRSPESDRLQSSVVGDGHAILAGAGLPWWKRWQASPALFAFAIDDRFVRKVWQNACNGDGEPSIQTSMGLDDATIRWFVRLGKQELDDGGQRGRIYVEGLATSLAVHILRKYAAPNRRSIQQRGGLPPALIRRIVDYVEAHISSDLGLIELAELAKLSPHHFGVAFKASTGTSPHQYVIERRVDRAREYLREPDRSIADVAQAVGFSSQSHLTTHFRRLTGVTPARFRRKRD